MRVLWTFLKVVLVLALAVPLSILVLGTALGILGALVGLAVLALKIAVLGLIGWGAFRLIRHLLGGSTTEKSRPAISAPAPVDRHYEAAMRELDQELGEAPPR